MSNKLVVTDAMLKELKKAIEENKKKPGPLMPTLHKAQEIFGCIPLEIQKIISEELDISVGTINGVVTFYSRFSTEPKGKHIIGVCLGTACYVRGSQEVLDAVSKELEIKVGETTKDGNFTLEATRCLGACGLAPVFTIGEEVYGNSTKNIAIEAIQKIKAEN
ncbi:MAG: NAD(P)H-dependent oxidoreductase subunit E [Acholeplasmatales bacterium]|nr:NAD(P)H-dependent oxidoreductase subunit E [Acholeplasmatales bacterium]